MTDMQSELRDRRAGHLDPAVEGGAVAVAGEGRSPANSLPRRRRVRTGILVFAVSMLAGGALSYAPRPVREVTREVSTQPGSVAPPVTMRLEEQSRGIPFRTWILQRGPADDAVKTHANIIVHPKGVVLNVLVTVLAGVLLLSMTGPRRPDA